MKWKPKGQINENHKEQKPETYHRQTQGDAGEHTGGECRVTSLGNMEEDGHRGWWSELTMTCERTLDYIHRHPNKGIRNRWNEEGKDRWGTEWKITGREKHTGGTEKQDVTHEGIISNPKQQYTESWHLQFICIVGPGVSHLPLDNIP